VKDFTDHAEVSRTDEGDLSTWEIGLKVFPDTFDENVKTNVPVTLTAGKLLGFMAAYCDNDGTYNVKASSDPFLSPEPTKTGAGSTPAFSVRWSCCRKPRNIPDLEFRTEDLTRITIDGSRRL